MYVNQELLPVQNMAKRFPSNPPHSLVVYITDGIIGTGSDRFSLLHI